VGEWDERAATDDRDRHDDDGTRRSAIGPTGSGSGSDRSAVSIHCPLPLTQPAQPQIVDCDAMQSRGGDGGGAWTTTMTTADRRPPGAARCRCVCSLCPCCCPLVGQLVSLPSHRVIECD
jgi:hypothetical protein